MRRISSGWTLFYKRVFPILWFGFLVVFAGIGVVRGQGLGVVIVPLAMIGFGYFLMQKLVFDLVDEVWDEGDALRVKNGGQEQRIALSDIKNVNYSPFMNPLRVTLSLRRPTVFGEQITFCGPVPPGAVFLKSGDRRPDRARRPRAQASGEARVARQQVARMERSAMRDRADTPAPDYAALHLGYARSTLQYFAIEATYPPLISA